VHVFPFSARPGTAAAELGAQVPVEVIRDRRARLSELAHEQGSAYRGSLHGVHDRVVLEGFAGLSGRYQRVRVPAEEIDGPLPPAVEVELEAVHTEAGDCELVGHPLPR
jgi:tRNA A37 methylthiotransferase MiaB